MIEADEGRSLLFEAADPHCALKPIVQHYMALSRMQHNGSEENKRALEWTTEQVCLRAQSEIDLVREVTRRIHLESGIEISSESCDGLGLRRSVRRWWRE